MRHIIEIQEGEWGLQHPLECRPDILGCAVHKAVKAAFDGHPPPDVGRFEVVLGEDGHPELRDLT